MRPLGKTFRAPEMYNILSRYRSALPYAVIVVVLLIMGILTAYYYPKTWGRIVDHKETYPGDRPFSFKVELGLDEDWHIKSWTDQEGTNFNVSLIGYPLVEGSEPEMSPTSCFTYNWKLRLEAPSTYSAYEFDLKVPWNPHGNKWMFNLLLEGHGAFQITITKFDRHSFYMFFIPDIVGSVIILAIITWIVKQKIKSSQKRVIIPRKRIYANLLNE